MFDEAFEITDKIIIPGMTEEEKVKAIHDYLIFNANYVNDGKWYDWVNYYLTGKGY